MNPTTRRRRRRATSILEFLIVMLFFLPMLLFLVDVSSFLMSSNAVNTAVYRSAREAAVRGGTDVGTCNSRPCFADAFYETLSDAPGGGSVTITSEPTPVSGSRCSAGDVVVIEVSFTKNFLTPGLGALFDDVRVTGVSRCEVDF
jgi:Flp pilus assembly protein TadG